MKNVEKWSFGYALLKPWVQFAHWLMHKEFHIIGRSNIPDDKPVIFAPNHQNALMDAVVLVTTAPGQTVFLGRADIFRKKLIARILYFIKLIPVYRIRDGKENLNKNEAIFNKAISILGQNKNLCLFPEGAHIGKRSMLIHKKAIPRIAFMAAEKSNNSIDIQVVPVGITYSHYYNFRRKLVVHYGDPIAAKPFVDLLHTDGEHAATMAFRNKIYDELSKLVVNIPDKNATDIYESAFTMVRSDLRKKLQLNKNAVDSIKIDQYFTDRLHKLLKEFPEKREWLIELQTKYNQLRSNLKIDEGTLHKEKLSFIQTFITLILTLITFPITVYGTIINGWLFYLTRYPYRKNIKDPQFWSSVSFSLGIIGFTIWYLILWLAFSQYFASAWLAFLVVIAAIPGGIIAWEVALRWRQILNRWRLKSLTNSNNSELIELKKQRAVLLNFYTNIYK